MLGAIKNDARGQGDRRAVKLRQFDLFYGLGVIFSGTQDKLWC